MFYYTICVLRTNVVFVLMFLTITPAVALIAALYFYAAAGNASQSHNCQVVSAHLPVFIFVSTNTKYTLKSRRLQGLCSLSLAS